MNNLLTNAWIVGIGVAVLSGLILYHVFGIGKKQQQNNKRIGILNEGKNTKILNNKINGMDIGIKDRGQNTITKDNELQ